MEVQNTLSVLMLVGFDHFRYINFKGVFALVHQINQGVSAFRITAKLEVLKRVALQYERALKNIALLRWPLILFTGE